MSRTKGNSSTEVWQVSRGSIRGWPGWILEKPTELKGEQGAYRNNEAPMVQTAYIVGWRSDHVLPLIVDIARRLRIKPETLSTRRRPIEVPIEEAYRLLLAFELVKRTRSIRRVEGIIEAIRGFQAEETYLWYSYLHEAKTNGKETSLTGSLALLGSAIA
jgi:hypothetical protein